MPLELDNKPGQQGPYDDGERGWYKPDSGSDEDTDFEKRFDEPSASDDNLTPGHPHRTKTPEELAEAESGTADATTGDSAASSETDQLGKGYTGKSKTAVKIIGKSVDFIDKKWLVGGGVGAGLIALIIAAFLSLLPLKINHIVENLQDRFFATTESAIERRGDKIFSGYIKRHVLPGMRLGDCQATKIDKSCVGPVPGSNKISRLYTAWRDHNLEGKISKNYGIEFARRGNNYFMTSRGTDIDLGTDSAGFLTSNQDIFEFIDAGGNNTGRKELRSKLKKALREETLYKRVLYRFKIGALLERKYGIKRCIFACNLRDDFSDWKDNKSRGAKIKIAERILAPRSEVLGLLFECMLDGGNVCKNNASDSEDNERRDVFQERLAQKLSSYEERFGADAVQKIIADSDLILDEGFTKYAIDKVFTKIGQQSAGEAINKGVPVVGWINAVGTIISKVKHVGPEYKRWVYATNALAMVSLYMMYRTHADEIKNGTVDSELVGSMVSALGDAPTKTDENGNPLPGESAELSPLYGEIFNESSSTNTSTSIFNILSPTAYAESQTKTRPNYTCDDNKPIAGDKLICPEESLKTDNYLTRFSELFNTGPLAPLGSVADFWTATGGKILGLVSNTAGSAIHFVLTKIPGYTAAENLVTKLAGEFFKAVANFLIPSPVSDNMSGARNVNMMIGGADEAGRSYAQYGLGGRKLSDTEVADIRNEQYQQRLEEFSQKPLYARMFDKQDSKSLVSQVAFAMPTASVGYAQSSVSSLLQNPFTKIFGSVGSVFSSPKAHAAVPTPDPFGISQYGYALDDPALSRDPETISEDCTSQIKQWTDDSGNHENPDTGMFENTTTAPCKLEDAAIASFGGLFDDTLLEESKAVDSVTLGNGGSKGEDTSSKLCVVGTDAGIKDTPDANVKIRVCNVDGIIVNVAIESNVKAITTGGKASGLTFGGGGYRSYERQIELRKKNCGPSSYEIYEMSSSLCSPPTARPGRSMHEWGLAVDFTCNGSIITNRGSACFNWLESNKAIHRLINLPSEAWHWSSSGN